MNKKKLIIIGAIVAVLLSVAVVIYASQKEETEPEFTIDGINLPTNKDILKDTTVNNLKITKASLLTRDGISSFTATLTNDTERTAKINKLYVVFYEGDTENKTLALYDTQLLSGKETFINITSETDLTNVTKIEYVIE